MCWPQAVLLFHTFSNTYATGFDCSSENWAVCVILFINWVIKPQEMGTSLRQDVWGEADMVLLILVSSDQVLFSDIMGGRENCLCLWKSRIKRVCVCGCTFTCIHTHTYIHRQTFSRSWDTCCASVQSMFQKVCQHWRMTVDGIVCALSWLCCKHQSDPIVWVGSWSDGILREWNVVWSM